jgi:DNA-binding NarL/FixJ family response regulator
VQGKTYVTPIIAGELIQTYQNSRTGENIIDRKLTDRQKEILHLVVEGYSAKEIANMLSISPRTVETHKYNMMQELNLKTTADLIKFAIKNNLTAL